MRSAGNSSLELCRLLLADGPSTLLKLQASMASGPLLTVISDTKFTRIARPACSGKARDNVKAQSIDSQR